MSERIEKCSVRDGRFVEPCWILEECVEDSGRGIFSCTLVNTTTFGPTRKFYALRSGLHRKKGVIINVCPFCGERIDTPFAEPKP